VITSATEGFLALDNTRRHAPGAFIGYPIGEDSHVLVPDPHSHPGSTHRPLQMMVARDTVHGGE
jgi:hypothetical protein